jgi:hypothetical protein
MILSARYANVEHTAAVALTDDFGAVALSLIDTPEGWSELHAWGTPDDYAAPSDVPVSVTPLQARKAIRLAGLKAAVDAYVSNLSEEQQEEWEYCVTVDRANGLVVSAAGALGMTDAQIDDLFRLAVTL